MKLTDKEIIEQLSRENNNMKWILRSLLEARKDKDLENWFDHYYKDIQEIVKD